MKFKKKPFIIKSIIKKISEKFTSSTWKDENTLIFKELNKQVGKVIFNDTVVNVTGEKFLKHFKKLLKEIEEKSKKEITADKAQKTIFKNMFNNINNYGGLEKNYKVFEKLCKDFENIGIGKIDVFSNIDNSDIINNKSLTLGIVTRPSNNFQMSYPSGYYGRLNNFIFNNYKTKYDSVTVIPIYDCSWIKSLEQEKTKEIKMKNFIVGKYFPERNYIHLYFNPFIQTTSLFGVKHTEIISDLLLVLNRLKPKFQKTNNITEKIFITEFLGNTRKHHENLKNQLLSWEQNITSYEKSIKDNIRQIHNGNEELIFLNKALENKGKGLFESLKETGKLPFLEDIKFHGGEIELKYKPTVIPVSNMKRNDNDKGFGKRYLWVGSITFKISPSEFNVIGDASFTNSYPHPHASSGDRTEPEIHSHPCFGEGEGRNKIYALLAQNNFYELAKMLWFWIKTYRNSGAYVKVWAAYDDRLKNGYPVFDADGTRINLNDPKRIKTGEQIKICKELLSSNYKQNFEKFKDTKIGGN